MSSKEEKIDKKLTDILADDTQRKKFAVGLFSILDKFLVLCVLGFISYRILTMDEKSRAAKIETTKALFGQGEKQKEENRKRLVEEESKKLYQ